MLLTHSNHPVLHTQGRMTFVDDYINDVRGKWSRNYQDYLHLMSFNGKDIVFCIDTYNSSIISHEYASTFVHDAKKYHAQSIIIRDGLSGFPNTNNFAITELIKECERQNIPYETKYQGLS